MRVAGNKLKHLSDFYSLELSGLYEPSEIQALFHLAAFHLLGFSHSDVARNINENINQSDLINLYDCCKDLKSGIPIQYIFGESEFYNLKLKVNPYVLIPRPETEELVELIIKENKNVNSVLDIGTGSGCIPIAIKKNLNSASVHGCDISEHALSTAQKNAELNNIKISFIKTDVLNKDVFSKDVNNTFDVIVSNPPYIKRSEETSLSKHVVDFEPSLALFVEGGDAIIFYKRIIELCEKFLNPNGKLYFELNPLTANEVKLYAENSRLFKNTELMKDMSGNIRFLKAEKSE